MTCTICHSELRAGHVVARSHGAWIVRCLCCGEFQISEEAAEDIAEWNLSETRWTAIAFRLRRMTDRSAAPLIDFDMLSHLRDRAKLPPLDELIDDFVLWVGANSPHPGSIRDVKYPEFKARLGAIGPAEFGTILHSLKASNLFQGEVARLDASSLLSMTSCQLTMSGWKRFRDLSRSRAETNHAFMAMNYGDAELDAIVQDHFTPAVSRTGLQLKRLDQGQPAGLIDDQLRVQIRASRLLVCDLTHANRGAYWEAGFAEGLGRPVIYTCREDVFRDAGHSNHPHFDTNHFVTVVWDPSDPSAAAQKLTSTIRATLPGEVIMHD